MAESVLIDAGFLMALLSRRDHYHRWAAAQSPRLALPWKTYEAVLSDFRIYRRHSRQVL